MRFLLGFGWFFLSGCSGVLASREGDLSGDAGAGDTDTDVDTDTDTDADADLDNREGPAFMGEADGFSSCLDGVDNDLDGLQDCAEPSCLRSFECCAGDALGLSDGFDGAGVDAGRWAAFGAPAPQVSGGWLSPGGDELYDSGVLSQGTFEPGMEIVVSAIADVPADCADLCLQTVGVGLTDKSALGSDTGVDPVAAVVLTADAGRLLLVAGGAVVAETNGVPTGSRIGVRLGTDGRVEGLVDGVPTLFAAAGSVAAALPLHAVVYGRSLDGTARVDEVQVTTTACANPAGGLRADAPVVAPRVGWDDSSVGAPCALLDADGRVVLYYETPRGIGRAVSDDGALFERQPTEAPVLEGPYAAPAALARGGAVWLAVDAPVAGGGARQIEVYVSDDAAGESFDGAARITLGAPEPWTSFEDPSLVDVEGDVFLYASLADDAGVTSIARLWIDPETWTAGELDVVLGPDAESVAAPDGIAAPGVTAERGWLEMWFEERDGLETRIRYAASGDGAQWEVFDGVVLDPSGRGWDALSVGDPSAVVLGAEQLLYYAGRSGSAQSIGLVTRVLPWTE